MRFNFARGLFTKRFGQLSIAMRLQGGFAVVLLLLACVGGVNLYQSGRLAQRMQELTEQDMRGVSTANEMRTAVQDMVIELGQMSRAQDPDDAKLAMEGYADAVRRYRAAKENLGALAAATANVPVRAAFEAVTTVEQDARVVFDQVATLAGSADAAAVSDLYTLAIPTPQHLWLDSLAKLNDVLASSMATASSEAQGSAKAAQWFTAVLVGVALVIGVLLAWLISRSITRPLQEAVQLAETVARGDLSVEMRNTRSDELGMLLNALAEMRQSLRQLVGNISECAEEIRTASSEVAGGNADLSRRTELAANNLQRTASSMERLANTVTQCAGSATAASDLASRARLAAHQGGKAVDEVVASMAEISGFSGKIMEIIGVIDEIAFKTNLLALNAAVEAAQAGEQGRGFAVVSGEVRNLSKRAAGAAKEIKELIGASVNSVESGSKLVRDAGKTMAEIVSAVDRLTDAIGDISNATAEQTSVLGHVTGALGELDQMTQQNTALVEESAASAEALHDQAGRLAECVGVFQLTRESEVDTVTEPTPENLSPA